MKTLVIDARMVGPERHGIARYVWLLSRGLEPLRAQGELPYEPVFLTRLGVTIDGFRCHEVQAPFLAPQELIEIPRALRALRADAYHSPSFSSLLNCPCPWLLTIHDLNHLTYGSLAQKLYYRFILKRFARKASALLTVSEFSRREIASWMGTDEKRIEVVQNALDPSFFEAIPQAMVDAKLAELGLKPGRYFLSLSNPKPHKNVPFLTRAYALYRNAASDPWPLVLTFTGMEEGEGVLQIGSLSDETVRILLSAAGGLFFPSLYEGFGLPPLEAASLGVRVAVSTIEPHREALVDLGPNEALWLDPGALSPWVDAFHQIQSGALPVPRPETRERMKARFSVEHLAKRMDEVYRRVLHCSPSTGKVEVEEA